MKRTVLLVILCLAVSSSIQAQSNLSNWYVNSGWEMIFSMGGTDNDGKIRFSPVLNLYSNYHYDLNENLGIMTGLALRNVGFQYESPDEQAVRFKYRTYNLGVPIGLKIGSMDKAYLYGGYELEWAFNYKEKRFENDKKVEKDVFWFNKRVNALQHSVFAGIQFYSGMNIKFKYYLSNFHNQDYVEYFDNTPTNPYASINTNLWYISLNFAIFKNTKFYYSDSSLGMEDI